MKNFLLVVLIALFFSILLASISHATERKEIWVNCLPRNVVINNVKAVKGELKFVAIDSYGQRVLLYQSKSGFFTIGFVPVGRRDLICPIFWGVDSAFVEEVGGAVR